MKLRLTYAGFNHSGGLLPDGKYSTSCIAGFENEKNRLQVEVLPTILDDLVLGEVYDFDIEYKRSTGLVLPSEAPGPNRS